MNPEKLKKLQAQAAEIRIGGKGKEFKLFSWLRISQKISQ